MELLTSLPAELVPLADPSTRGAAPLLRPAEADAGSGTLPASFDAYLALLAMPLPAGEPWPLTGKELPTLPVSGAAAGQALDGDALASGAADAALLARLRLAAAPAADAPEAFAAPPFPAVQADASTALPSGVEPTAAPSLAPDVDVALGLETAAPPMPEAPPLDTAEPAVEIPSAESSDLPSWLDTLAARDERASRSTPTHGDPRLPTTAAAAAAPAQAAAVAPPAAEAAAIVRDAGMRNDDAPKISPALGVTSADAPSASRPEWLPAGHAATTTASVPAPAAPATPVDLRSPGWQEAFANRVQMHVDSGVNEARITLHPPELGAVDIEISLVDDKTFVQLTTATAAARDELSHSLPRLRELFTVSGLELGGAGVHHGRDGYGAGRGDGAFTASPRYFAPLADLGEDVPVAARSRPVGRIDVFA